MCSTSTILLDNVGLWGCTDRTTKLLPATSQQTTVLCHQWAPLKTTRRVSPQSLPSLSLSLSPVTFVHYDLIPSLVSHGFHTNHRVQHFDPRTITSPTDLLKTFPAPWTESFSHEETGSWCTTNIDRRPRRVNTKDRFPWRT